MDTFIQEINRIEDEMNQQIASRHGFTRGQLKEAFEKVQNKEDWKDEVMGYCSAKDKILIREAVVFFTATEPRFTKIGRNSWRVYAPGYRLGPAGDH